MPLKPFEPIDHRTAIGVVSRHRGEPTSKLGDLLFPDYRELLLRVLTKGRCKRLPEPAPRRDPKQDQSNMLHAHMMTCGNGAQRLAGTTGRLDAFKLRLRPWGRPVAAPDHFSPQLIVAQVTEETRPRRAYGGNAPAALNRRPERYPRFVGVLPK